MLTVDQQKAYVEELKELGDDELIDAFHEARCKRNNAEDDNKDETFLRAAIAESVMEDRFGLGKHMKRYKARYP